MKFRRKLTETSPNEIRKKQTTEKELAVKLHRQTDEKHIVGQKCATIMSDSIHLIRPIFCFFTESLSSLSREFTQIEPLHCERHSVLNASETNSNLS